MKTVDNKNTIYAVVESWKDADYFLEYYLHKENAQKVALHKNKKRRSSECKFIVETIILRDKGTKDDLHSKY